MKRTARYVTLSLNVGMGRTIGQIVHASVEGKGHALVLLGRALNWHILDDKRRFRLAVRGSATSLPVDLLDQAPFDAVDTMKRDIQAAVAQGHRGARCSPASRARGARTLFGPGARTAGPVSFSGARRPIRTSRSYRGTVGRQHGSCDVRDKGPRGSGHGSALGGRS